MLCPDGKLNVDLLRKEIASDVSLHDRYRAEDAMKKRAIHSSELVPRCRAQYSINDLTRLPSLPPSSPIALFRSIEYQTSRPKLRGIPQPGIGLAAQAGESGRDVAAVQRWRRRRGRSDSWFHQEPSGQRRSHEQGVQYRV